MDAEIVLKEYRVGEEVAMTVPRGVYDAVYDYATGREEVKKIGDVLTLVAGTVTRVEEVYEKGAEPGDPPVSVYIEIQLPDGEIIAQIMRPEYVVTEKPDDHYGGGDDPYDEETVEEMLRRAGSWGVEG